MAGFFHLRLTSRLVLAHSGVSVLGILVAVFVYHALSGPLFGEMLLDQGQEHMRADATYYFREHGSLVGIDSVLPSNQISRGPSGSGHQTPLPFGLADQSGKIIYPGQGYTAGDVADSATLGRGRPIIVDGALVGTILPPLSNPSSASPAQRAYVERIGLVERGAVLLGALVASVIGVVLSRGITSPIKRLTAAVREMAASKSGRPLPAAGSTELARLTTTFNAMSMELASYEEKRKQLAADIAYELRTPLTTISGYVEAMRGGELEPTAERLGAVFRETQRLTNVIEDLRLLALADAGALHLKTDHLSVLDLLSECVRAHSSEAVSRGIDLRAESDSSTLEVEADGQRIRHAIEILLANALHHTKEGEVVLSTKQEGDTAVVQVSDTSPGLAPDIVSGLFDRVHHSSARGGDTHGWGLRLAAAGAIVRAHKASIAVESEPGKGTTFTIRLPLVASPELAV